MKIKCTYVLVFYLPMCVLTSVSILLTLEECFVKSQINLCFKKIEVANIYYIPIQTSIFPLIAASCKGV